MSASKSRCASLTFDDKNSARDGGLDNWQIHVKHRSSTRDLSPLLQIALRGVASERHILDLGEQRAVTGKA